MPPILTPTPAGGGGDVTDDEVVHDTGDETVAGVKTFSSSPIVPTPTTATQAAPKGYVDDEIIDLPSLENGDEIDFVEAGSPPSETLTPRLSGPAALRNLGNRAGATVSATASATTLLASTLTPAAGAVAIGDILHFEAVGTTTQNSGGSATIIFRLRVGGSNLVAFSAVTIATASATSRPWRVEATIHVQSGSGGTLVGIGTMQIGPVTTDTADLMIRTVNASPLVVDLNAWGAIDLTVQHSTATSFSTTAYGLQVKRTPA